MKLMAAIDFSAASPAVLSEAQRWAKQLSARLWLVHVAEPDPDFVGYRAGPQSVREQVAKKFHKEHQELERESEELRKQGLDVTALLVQGPTAETILAEAQRLEADMIIMGSRGHGVVHELLVGSVSSGVIRKSACPVLIVPTHKRQPEDAGTAEQG